MQFDLQQAATGVSVDNLPYYECTYRDYRAVYYGVLHIVRNNELGCRV